MGEKWEKCNFLRCNSQFLTNLSQLFSSSSAQFEISKELFFSFSSSSFPSVLFFFLFGVSFRHQSLESDSHSGHECLESRLMCSIFVTTLFCLSKDVWRISQSQIKTSWWLWYLQVLRTMKMLHHCYQCRQLSDVLQTYRLLKFECN